MDNNEEPIPIKQTTESHIEEPAPIASALVEPDSLPKSISAVTIKKEIQSWGITMTILGILNIQNIHNDPMELFLILVGLSSFYFKSTAILVVFSISLFWLAVKSLIFSKGYSPTYMVIQFILSAFLFWRFIIYRRVEIRLGQEKADLCGLKPQRSSRLFPWIGLALGELSFLGMIVFFISILVIRNISPNTNLPISLATLLIILFYFAVIGFAIGLASIQCHHPNQSASIGGMIGSIITILVFSSFLLVGLMNP